MPSVSPAQLLVGTPGGTGAGLGRAFLTRSAPIYTHQTPKSFAGHQSVLLTVVSFEANAYIQRLNIYYTIYPALYDIVISILMKNMKVNVML